MNTESSGAGLAQPQGKNRDRIDRNDPIKIRSYVPPEILERLIMTTLQNATAAAALNCSHAVGRGDRNWADALAVEAMRGVMNRELLVPAQVVIGEGERDEAPMLYIGEILGPPEITNELRDADEAAQEKGVVLEIAVDPLEGTNLCAEGKPGAIAVMAATLRGQGRLLHAPDCYMDKIVVGRDVRKALPEAQKDKLITTASNHGLIDNSLEQIVHLLSLVHSKPIDEISAMVLDRPYNADLIRRLRALNVRLSLISDGDITAGLLALDPDHPIDLAIGKGAAPEGVITAAIAQVYRGYMEGRLWVKSDQEGALQRARAEAMGLDFEKLLHLDDLAQGFVMFSLTTITYNQLDPNGVRWLEGGQAISRTFSGRSRSGSINISTTRHQSPPPRPAPPENGYNLQQ